MCDGHDLQKKSMKKMNVESVSYCDYDKSLPSAYVCPNEDGSFLYNIARYYYAM